MIAAAEIGKPWRGINGHDRAILYRVAVGTGFRAGELQSLTAHSITTDGDTPCILLRAKTSKRRREDMQPIRSDLATKLAEWIDGNNISGQLWPGTWHKKAAMMVRRDMKVARKQYLDAAESTSDAQNRAESDFMLVEDQFGPRC